MAIHDGGKGSAIVEPLRRISAPPSGQTATQVFSDGRNRLLYDAADSHIRGDAGEDTLIVGVSVNSPSDVGTQDKACAVDIGGQHYTRWECGDSALFIDADSALNNVVDNGEHGVFT